MLAYLVEVVSKVRSYLLNQLFAVLVFGNSLLAFVLAAKVWVQGAGSLTRKH